MLDVREEGRVSSSGRMGWASRKIGVGDALQATTVVHSVRTSEVMEWAIEHIVFQSGSHVEHGRWARAVCISIGATNKCGIFDVLGFAHVRTLTTVTTVGDPAQISWHGPEETHGWQFIHQKNAL